MAQNVDALIREGVKALRDGNKAEARAFLERAVELDERNEQAWLWLSAVVDTPEDQRTCLENVLVINPDNANAKQGLQMLGGTPPAAPSPESPPTPAFTEPESPTSTSVEWEAPPTATSSPSAIYNPANEPTSADYDNWLSGLNLNTGSNVEDTSTNIFTDVDEIFGQDFFDDDVDEAPAQPAVPPARDPIMEDLRADEYEDDLQTGGGTFTSGPFDASTLDLDDLDLEQEKPAVRSTQSKMSPGAEKPATRGGKPATSPGAALVDFDEEYESLNYNTDPSTFFKFIPEEISATRLPGTKERYSPLLLIGLITLILLNAGALVMFLSTLTG